ncbi:MULTISPECIES: hypothetical protein [unclassified Crossiella]|uniref:hypothetical protein n=1 Tax=unclassified Crossiella TaxID=2620835 RepID=UPI001FFFA125|nr:MULTISPECIES: hypothetical protein [unclassified Crossiella]MCK2240001.1 hypothetical protein [Crossiella sp. S99.2]MCK2252709.1 hypothetical protein [Crossiella sp. S99.1]
MRRREELVRCHGNFDAGWGTGEWVYPGRTVIEVPGWTWAVARPEDCPDVPVTRCWYDREGYRLPNLLGSNARRALVLLCGLCGLDCT